MLLPASSAPLQYHFYPICTTLPTSCHPADTRKTLVLFPTNLMFRRTNVSAWHAETGSAPAKHLPQCTMNTTPGHGLQVEFCPWEGGTQAQHLLLRPPALRLLLWEMLPPPTPVGWLTDTLASPHRDCC